MQKDIYIKKTLEEVQNKVFGVTKSFFEIYSLVEKKGEIQVERIDFDFYPNTAIVYLPVHNEHFFLAFYFKTSKTPILTGVELEGGHRAYFTATSETLSFDELASMTTLKNLTGWNKGDIRKSTKLNLHKDTYKYSFTRLIFDPFPSRAYDMGLKVKLLLNEMEKDTKGIKKLLKAATHTGISCSNNMPLNTNNGFHLDVETTSKLGKLGLSIDFDQYIVGQRFLNTYNYKDGSDLVRIY
jgi:hypothetical protein